MRGEWRREEEGEWRRDEEGMEEGIKIRERGGGGSPYVMFC